MEQAKRRLEEARQQKIFEEQRKAGGLGWGRGAWAEGGCGLGVWDACFFLSFFLFFWGGAWRVSGFGQVGGDSFLAAGGGGRVWGGLGFGWVAGLGLVGLWVCGFGGSR